MGVNSIREIVGLGVVMITVIGSATTTGVYVGGLVASLEGRMKAVEAFMAPGARCTAADCGSMTARIAKLEREDEILEDKIDDLPRPPPLYKELVDKQLIELREIVRSLGDQVEALSVQVGNHRNMIRLKGAKE